MTTAVQHAATAARLREQADEMDLIAGVIFDASSLHDAAARLRAIADAKRSSSVLLDEMAQQQPAEHCVCCTYDCGDRSGHVRSSAYAAAGSGDRCNCGRPWPCELAS